MANKRPKTKLGSLSGRGFSLLELLVSITILAIIVMALSSILSSSTTAWRRGSSKIQTFQDARAAYEAVTRKLSQATLNVYWDYETDSSGNPVRYRRQSELAFVSGAEAVLLPAESDPRTHAVFFQAPLGFSAIPETNGLESLLNACGYFLDFGPDTDDRPPFLADGALVPTRHRFRLKELWEPTENLRVYQNTPATNWISATPSAVLAENIIALVILPKLPQREDPTGAALAPDYLYNSTDPSSPETHNQLPPLVQVVMIAIDESSATRAASGTNAPTYGVDWNQVFQNAENLNADLQTVESRLVSEQINYQVFNSTIALEGAKWSR